MAGRCVDACSRNRGFLCRKASEPEAVLVAEDDVGLIVGFAEFSIRTDIPSLEGRRTGYVEGLYVMPEFRSRARSDVLGLPATGRIG